MLFGIYRRQFRIGHGVARFGVVIFGRMFAVLIFPDDARFVFTERASELPFLAA